MLRLLAGGLLAGAPLGLPLSLGAAPRKRLYLGAGVSAGGSYRVSGFRASGARVFDLGLPGRGHSFAVRPDRRTAVLFARRPGRFALVLDLVRGAVAAELATPRDRHCYGHGVFSRDGRFLYASENDFQGERGVIGIYDAGKGYQRAGELPSHGIGPHEIGLLSDGTTLVIANGGILMRPDLPRVKLNVATMAPSLCYVHRGDGGLVQEHRLRDRLHQPKVRDAGPLSSVSSRGPAFRRNDGFERRLDPALHQLSIRHLAVGRDDTVAVAMQYEGPRGDLVPLVALHRPGAAESAPLLPLQAAPGVWRAMKQYCGSVCFDPGGRVLAVSAPRGNLVTFWDVGAGVHLRSSRIDDGSGIAPGERPGEFLASSGRGGAAVIDAFSGKATPLDNAFVNTRQIGRAHV